MQQNTTNTHVPTHQATKKRPPKANNNANAESKANQPPKRSNKILFTLRSNDIPRWLDFDSRLMFQAILTS